jgi:tetratricopeptide (TPR) repeat protein
VLVFALGLGLNQLLWLAEPTYFSFMGLDIQDGVDRAYNGLYAQEKRFLTAKEQIPVMRITALEQAQKRIGLGVSHPEKYIVMFRDSHDFFGFGASSQIIRTDRGEIHLVSLSPEQMVLGVMDTQASMVHEFIHSIMKDRMGENGYRAIPQWIREGLAVWGADQLRERAKNIIANAFLEHRNFDWILNEVGDFDHPLDYYLTVALAFDYIQYNYSEEVVRRLVVEIVEGRNPYAAFRTVTGLSMSELESECHVFVRLYFKRVLFESGYIEFQEAQRLYQAGDIQGASEKLLAIIHEKPDSLLEPQAWYWLGQWSFESRRYANAALAYSMVIKYFPKHLGLREDSMVQLERCYFRMQDSDIGFVENVAGPIPTFL